MATWVDYKTTDYTGYLTATYKESGRVKVTLQYDKDTITPVKMKIRFKIDNPKDYYRGDEYFIFWRPNDKNDEKFFRVKEANTAWPDYSSTLEITKKYTDASFSIPEHWLCHTGNICNGKTVFTKTDGYLYMTYGDAATKKIYWYFTNNRKNYKTIISAHSVTVSGTKATAVSVSAPTITDHGNNTYTITASAGKAGTSNAVKSSTLYYRAGGSGDYTKASSLTAISKKKLSVSNSTASQTIYAYTVVDGTYNDVTSSTTSKAVKNYVMPSYPGKPALSSGSYKNGRLTIKQNWTYTWTASTQANSSSPVNGYRIRIYKNGAEMTGLIQDGTNGIKKGTNSKGYVDRATASTTVTFDPAALGFLPTDKVKIGLHSWTTNGAGTILWSGSGTTQVYSDEVTVQHAGIVRINIGTSTAPNWKEGQVFVNLGTSTAPNWKEADAVYVNIGTSTAPNWQESE